MVGDLFANLGRERASGRSETLADWRREHPLPADRFTLTLHGIPARVRAGTPFLEATREFLDEFRFRPDGLRAAALVGEPASTGDPRHDAFLGALAEFLSPDEPPSWPAHRSRFLDRFWFVTSVPGFRAHLIATSPAAFRRRGVFVSPDLLEPV